VNERSRLSRHAMALLAVLPFAACGNSKQDAPHVTFRDEAHVWGNGNVLENDLVPFAERMNVDITVVTAASLDPVLVVATANEAGSNLIDADRSWLARRFQSSWAADDIVFYYSLNPRLLQIRFGDDIKLQAETAGLTEGAGYVDLLAHAFPPGSSQPDLQAAAAFIQERWVSRGGVSWFDRNLLATLRDDAKDLSEWILTPEWGMLYSIAGAGAGKLLALVSTVASSWWAVTFLFVLLLALVRILLFALTGALAWTSSGGRLPVFGQRVAIWWTIISITVLFPFLLIPAFALFLRLGIGRPEDLVVLQALGVTMSGFGGFSLHWYGLLLCGIVIFSVVAIQKHIEFATHGKVVDENGEDSASPGTVAFQAALSTFLWLFFLPGVVVLAWTVYRVSLLITTILEKRGLVAFIRSKA